MTHTHIYETKKQNLALMQGFAFFCLIGNYNEFPIKQKHFVQTMRTRTRRNYCFASVLGAGKKAVLLIILFA